MQGTLARSFFLFIFAKVVDLAQLARMNAGKREINIFKEIEVGAISLNILFLYSLTNPTPIFSYLKARKLRLNQ